MTKSLPGICGKPRKLTVLLKRLLQVSNRLSQPAVIANLSPTKMGPGMACQSSMVTAPSLRWSLTSTLKPAFAPLVNVSLPALNQASSKLSRPLALKTEVALIAVTTPLPRKRTSVRSMPHRLSPRSAEQVAVKSRPLTWESRSFRPRTSAVKPAPSRLTSPKVPFARRTHKLG